MKTFETNFVDSSGNIDIKGIAGFTNALRQLYLYISKQTEFKPEKRYIDAVPLLDIIAETNAELALLLNEADAKLKSENEENKLHPIFKNITDSWQEDLLLQSKKGLS